MTNAAHVKYMRALIPDQLCNPDLTPFITLVVSNIKDKHLLKSKPLLLSDSLRASKRFHAEPMLTIGMSRNLVRTSPTFQSKTWTRLMHDLSVLSFDSSIKFEKNVDMSRRVLAR